MATLRQVTGPATDSFAGTQSAADKATMDAATSIATPGTLAKRDGGGNLAMGAASTAGGSPIETQGNKGQANGYAGLDGSGKVPSGQLPSAVTGGFDLQGAWNASTNSPSLSSGVGTTGYLYTVSVAGTHTLDGISQWDVGDDLFFDGTHWQRLAGGGNTVVTFNGRFGAVSPQTGDYSAAQISGLAASATTDTTNASNITTGKVALARGGTDADLSATGGASQVLKQSSAGGAVTVGQLAAGDISGLGTAAALNAGTSADDVVQLLSGGKLPGVDGSNLTNLPTPGSSVVATFGEAVSVTGNPLVVYEDTFNERSGGAGLWYLADNSAASPVIKHSLRIGCLSASVANGGTATVQTSGAVTGFSGLSGGPVWLGTSGAVTGTKPPLPASGSLVFLLRVGTVTAGLTGAVNLVQPTKVTAICNIVGATAGSSATLRHLVDATPRERITKAYIPNVPTYPATLLAYYPMEDGSGGVFDYAGGHSGSAVGGPTWSGSNLPSLSLPDTTAPSLVAASSQYFNVPNWLGALNLSSLSVAVWVYFPNSNADQIVFHNYNGSGGWALGPEAAASGAWRCYYGAGTLHSASPIPNGTWTHVTTTFSSVSGTTTMTIYINGTSSASTTASTSSITFNSTSFANTIGQLGNGAQFCTCTLKELRVYAGDIGATGAAHLAAGDNEDGSAAYPGVDLLVPTGGNSKLTAGGIYVPVQYADGSNENGDNHTTFTNELGFTSNLVYVTEVFA